MDIKNVYITRNTRPVRGISNMDRNTAEAIAERAVKKPYIFAWIIVAAATLLLLGKMLTMAAIIAAKSASTPAARFIDAFNVSNGKFTI